MSGVGVSYSMQGTQEAQRVFGQLRLVVASPAPVLGAIRTGLIENTHTRFESAVDPDGGAWQALNPGYASIKRGAGILREAGMRGGLMGSITGRVGGDAVEIGTNKIYAAVHQFGATIKPVSAPRLRFRMASGLVGAESVTIPARPYLGIGREDELTILDTLEDALIRATMH